MSNQNKISSTIENMGSPFFHEFKKQASFFLKQKIKTARLAFTDVTPAQLLAEEAINGNPGAPETRILKMISKAAFEIDDYSRIVEILHKRFGCFDTKSWRASYNSLIVLEYLLTHGPESVAMEFDDDKDAIRKTGSFQHVDEKGFNWGLTVKNKVERIVNLLENRPLLKEERNRARTVTRGIEGFGSFKIPTSSNQGILQESSKKTYNKSISQFNYYRDEDDNVSDVNSTYPVFPKAGISQQTNRVDANSENSFHDHPRSFKENMTPRGEKGLYEEEDFEKWNSKWETNLLLGEKKNTNPRIVAIHDDHPFNHSENKSGASLLSSTDHVLQAC